MKYTRSLLLFTAFAFYCAFSVPIFQQEGPPSRIVINQQVTYLYDPSEYIYSPNSIFKIDGNVIGGLTSKDSTNISATNVVSFRMPEDEFGSWDLDIPALILVPNNTLYWAPITSKDTVPKLTSDNSLQVTTDSNVKCFDAIAYDAETAIVDCWDSSQNMSYIYTVDLNQKNINATFNSNTNVSSINQPRRLSVYEFDNETLLYRVDPSNANMIEVFNIDDPTNITAKAPITSTSLGFDQFSPVALTILNGVLFVSNKNTPKLTRLDYNDSSLTNLQYNNIDMLDYLWNIKAVYDITYGSSSVSVIGAGTYGIYRVNWTLPSFPIVAEAYHYGLSYPLNDTPSAYVFASQNFFYSLVYDPNLETQNLFVFMRKRQNAYLIANLTSVPGTPYAIAVDIFTDNLIILTSQGQLQNFQVNIPRYPITPSSTDTSKSINVTLQDPTGIVYSFIQNFTVQPSGLTGIFYNQPYNASFVLPTNNLQQSFFSQCNTFAVPVNFTTSGIVSSFTLRPRSSSVPLTVALNTTDYDSIAPNPYIEDNFYWIRSAKDSLTADVLSCIFNSGDHEVQNISCVTIITLNITGNIQSSAFLFSSEEENPNFVALITQDQPTNLTIFNLTDGSSNVTADLSCNSLYQSSFTQNSYAFCLTASNIVGWYLDDNLVPQTFVIDNTVIQQDSFAPTQIVSSPGFENVIFVSDSSNIYIINMAFSYTSNLQLLATVPIDSSSNFVVSEKKIIVATPPSKLYAYDITNLKSPFTLNANVTSNLNFKANSLFSSGSSLFILTLSDGTTVVLDSTLPDITNTLQVNYSPTVLAIVPMSRDADVIISKSNNNSAVVVYHKMQFNVSVSTNTTNYINTGSESFQFAATPGLNYATYVQVVDSTKLTLNTSVSNNVTLNLTLATDKTKPFSYTSPIEEFFTGNMNGTYNLIAQIPNETHLFTFTPPYNVQSTHINLNTSAVISGFYANQNLTLLYVDDEDTLIVTGNPSLNNFSPTGIVYPPDSNDYTCSSIIPYNSSFNLIACNHPVFDFMTFIFQNTDSSISSYFEVWLDQVIDYELAAQNGMFFIIGVNNSQNVLLAYTLNPTPTLVLNQVMESLFQDKFNHIVDLAVATVDPATTARLWVLDNFGIRTIDVTLNSIAAWAINITAASFWGPAFNNYFIPTKAPWAALETLNCNNYTNIEGCFLLLIQQNGDSYLVNWDYVAGLTNMIAVFNQYYQWQNQKTPHYMTQKFFYMVAQNPQTQQQAILTYPVGNADFDEDIPSTMTVAAFNYSSIIIPNLDKSDCNLYTLDNKGNFLNISYTGNFSITFQGNASQMNSTYVILQSFGGDNAIASANISLILPPAPKPQPDNPPKGSNLGLFAAVIVVAIIIVFVVVIKRKKAAQERILKNDADLSLSNYKQLNNA